MTPFLVIRIGFEQTSYDVLERTGFVEICACVIVPEPSEQLEKNVPSIFLTQPGSAQGWQ